MSRSTSSPDNVKANASRSATGGIARGAGFMLVLLSVGFPLYWLIKSGLSTYSQLFTMPPTFLPWPLQWGNFADQITQNSTDFVISGIIAVGCVVLVLITAAPLSYGLSMLKGRAASIAAMSVVLGGLMLPPIMFVIPLFEIFASLGLINTVPGLIIADATYSFPLAVLVCFTFFRKVPNEIIEAAQIDGAGQMSTFVRIVCPVSSPALATSAIFAFLLAWGDYLFGVTLGAGRTAQPIAVRISGFVVPGTNAVTQWQNVMALSVLAALPALVIVIFAQKYISNGMTAGVYR